MPVLDERDEVEVEGRGFDADREVASGDGTGLPGIRERARMLGGRVAVESVPGAGTTLTVELPVPAPRTASRTLR